MGIATFIEETLMDIRQGLMEANKKSGSNLFVMMMHDKVDFDLAVVVSERQEGESTGKIGIAAVASIGGANSTENQSEKTTRIKFAVKVAYNNFGSAQNI
ncbi:MAG: hypothetical protein KGI41_00785 [Patescibacteria group bacterium]|nr:hypothetical protein [Patescibacteria group bacterium]MDE1965764.1 hypothetical protein [Patescibacteria group bacterium]